MSGTKDKSQSRIKISRLLIRISVYLAMWLFVSSLLEYYFENKLYISFVIVTGLLCYLTIFGEQEYKKRVK